MSMEKKERSKPNQWDQMSRITYLRKELRSAHKDMEAARKRQSWQAVASLRRQALSVRNELDQLKILQDQEEEQAAQPDDLVRSLVEAVRVLPLDHVERVADACHVRIHGAPRLEVLS